MTTDNFQPSQRPLVVAVTLSVLLHVVLFVVFNPADLMVEPDPPVESEEFTVQTLTEEDLETLDMDPVEKEDPLTRTQEVKVEAPEEPDTIKPPDDVKPPPPDADPKNRKVVVQETNSEHPTEAKFLSDQDNKVARETRAKETVNTDLTPGRETEMAAARIEQKEQMPTPDIREGQPAPEHTPNEEVPDHEAEHEHESLNPDSPMVQRPKVDIKRLFQPSMADYNQVFGDRDQKARKRILAQEGAKKPMLFRGWEDRDKALRAAVENFITEIQPGNHTGVNAHRSSYASYIARIHRKIHPRWAHGYLMFLDTASDNPLNNPKLTTKLEMVIRARDGLVENVNIVSSSGELQFDAEAISIANAIGRHPKPPPQIVSPNGRVYIHWQFWRDTRQCGTFGASVFLLNVDEG